MTMIDVGKKQITTREALVEATVTTKSDVIEKIRQGTIKKGNVLEAARIAGILAVKKTPEIIPLCHPISIEYVDIVFQLSDNQVGITTTVRGCAKTGVEMEALAGATVAALTIYDMCKYIDKEIVISDIQLLRKTGGKSGTFLRNTGKNNI